MSALLSREALAIGVDVGGTKVAAGLVDSRGEILYRTRAPMVANAGADKGFAAVRAAVDAVLQTANGEGTARLTRGIGICSPGPLDPKSGVVINPPNLPCWRNFPLAAEMARSYGVPVTVDNDGNAAGLAEWLWGAGRGYHNVFYVCIGTGIGSAIVLDGRIHHGRTGAAGEGGHVSIDYKGPTCGCGKPGCIEILASGPAMIKRAKAKLETGRPSSLLELAGGKVDFMTGEMLGRAYSAGDALATEVLRETVELLAYWLGNIIDLLEPDVIIVGGGAGSMLQPFFGELQDQLPHCCVNARCREIPMLPARYGADAGIAGGAALCFQSAGSHEEDASIISVNQQ
jgi:glucokinase